MKDINRPLVLENSPVSFALIGPGGLHRRTIARSKHDNLHFLAFDGDSRRRSPGTFATRLIWGILPFGQKERVHFVRTEKGDVSISEGEKRFTYLTFVWQGIARREDLIEIQDTIDFSSSDIMNSIKNDDHDSVEWHLAKLVWSCKSITDRNAEHIRSKQLAFWFACALYVSLLLYSKIDLRVISNYLTGDGF